LHSTFLYERIQKNPRHYRINELREDMTWQERMDEIVQKSVEDLRQHQLVKVLDDGETLAATDYGETMAKVNIHDWLRCSQ
jgi:ATP-dependent DNA helicase HFM1/MER3